MLWKARVGSARRQRTECELPRGRPQAWLTPAGIRCTVPQNSCRQQPAGREAVAHHRAASAIPADAKRHLVAAQRRSGAEGAALVDYTVFALAPGLILIIALPGSFSARRRPRARSSVRCRTSRERREPRRFGRPQRRRQPSRHRPRRDHAPLRAVGRFRRAARTR